jgi:hypothetical protein
MKRIAISRNISRTGIWYSLIVIVFLLALWFIVKAGLAIFSYYQLSVQVPAKISQWSVEEIKPDQFAVFSTYTFDYKGKAYQGKSKVGNFYPNPWAANRAKGHFVEERWFAWINPKYPDQNQIGKTFPYKKAISAAILIGLLIYFSFLALYVRMKN